MGSIPIVTPDAAALSQGPFTKQLSEPAKAQFPLSMASRPSGFNDPVASVTYLANRFFGGAAEHKARQFARDEMAHAGKMERLNASFQSIMQDPNVTDEVKQQVASDYHETVGQMGLQTLKDSKADKKNPLVNMLGQAFEGMTGGKMPARGGKDIDPMTKVGEWYTMAKSDAGSRSKQIQVESAAMQATIKDAQERGVHPADMQSHVMRHINRLMALTGNADHVNTIYKASMAGVLTPLQTATRGLESDFAARVSGGQATAGQADQAATTGAPPSRIGPFPPARSEVSFPGPPMQAVTAEDGTVSLVETPQPPPGYTGTAESPAMRSAAQRIVSKSIVTDPLLPHRITEPTGVQPGMRLLTYEQATAPRQAGEPGVPVPVSAQQPAQQPVAGMSPLATPLAQKLIPNYAHRVAWVMLEDGTRVKATQNPATGAWRDMQGNDLPATVREMEKTEFTPRPQAIFTEEGGVSVIDPTNRTIWETGVTARDTSFGSGSADYNRRFARMVDAAASDFRVPLTGLTEEEQYNFLLSITPPDPNDAATWRSALDEIMARVNRGSSMAERGKSELVGAFEEKLGPRQPPSAGQRISHFDQMGRPVYAQSGGGGGGTSRQERARRVMGNFE